MIIIRNRIFCAKLRFGGKTGSRHRFRFVESLRLPSTMAVIFENRRRIVLRRQHRAEPWFFCVEKTDAGKVRRESDKIDISQAFVFHAALLFLHDSGKLSPSGKTRPSPWKNFRFKLFELQTVIAYLPAAILHKIHAEKFVVKSPK